MMFNLRRNLVEIVPRPRHLKYELIILIAGCSLIIFIRLIDKQRKPL